MVAAYHAVQTLLLIPLKANASVTMATTIWVELAKHVPTILLGMELIVIVKVDIQQ